MESIGSILLAQHLDLCASIYSVNFWVCVFVILFTHRTCFPNSSYFPFCSADLLRFIKGHLDICVLFFFSDQKLYFGSFTKRLTERKFLFCVPRGDVVVIKLLAPISCLKEIADYRLNRHETGREANCC